MSGKEMLTLEEFATAPRRPRPVVQAGPERVEIELPPRTGPTEEPLGEQAGERGETSNEASKALRRMKRKRMKGASNFVNVNLDRDTKRRLKLASFNLDTSMQALMEKAIRHYLDANGF